MSGGIFKNFSLDTWGYRPQLRGFKLRNALTMMLNSSMHEN